MPVTVSTQPRQARAQETYERLLTAGQVVLERGGLEAFNSNAVAAAAGATPPSFYRYFRNKHELLAELGRRLMNVQNAVIEQRSVPGAIAAPFADDELERVLSETLAVTRKFRGGRAIISSLRAVPELAPIRLESHAHVAGLIALQLEGTGLTKPEAYERARLAVELGYAAIEMLLEVKRLNAARTLRATARAVAACLAPDRPGAAN
ncbi:TetR/AcrR family transcriptional regulator [Hyphomonas sp.]|uniref:TetR/AcrR family transcriptional regulator n=1 Tax=Hyphomonas sp. TaxID=87 RepID=UPI001DFA6E29|nr:TetR/AcrR family transcriptional regulator [Hyphomonas sp.]MBU3921735.1 TetR/AcrR family transcriptional regulator [Alphaproteobacteria bacterium]MBU4060312.1 TetR/AcrR family transcriptional regulator [Alphaproteobacteria bacterium]MBU4162980.1 TetR/AcrR family transcriptional regulator [Alphaproteobacteria bacterium]